jgi:hypothetical protein
VHHGRREAVARAHGDDLLPYSMNSNEGGDPVILWPRRGAGSTGGLRWCFSSGQRSSADFEMAWKH